METGNAQNAKVFKAFCDENRLTILALLCTGEKCACRLQEALSIGQSTLSHHMKILCESGVVVARKEGKWTYYAIDQIRSTAAATLLQRYTEVQSDARDISCAPSPQPNAYEQPRKQVRTQRNEAFVWLRKQNRAWAFFNGT